MDERGLSRRGNELPNTPDDGNEESLETHGADGEEELRPNESGSHRPPRAIVLLTGVHSIPLKVIQEVVFSFLKKNIYIYVYY